MPTKIAAKHPEFMIRVKMPSSAEYHSSSGGIGAYNDACRTAIHAAKPPGYEVRWPILDHKWAVDSEGYTLVPLYCTDERKALAHYLAEVERLEKKLAEIRRACQ